MYIDIQYTVLLKVPLCTTLHVDMLQHTFSEMAFQRICRERAPRRGRTLYKIKDSILGDMNETNNSPRMEMKNDSQNWTNIGYVRKTSGKYLPISLSYLLACPEHSPII
ncbi:hypothetical protein BCR42DRAFT_495603 [Absidia repens]|uniref:Uncharacterized protein n=1 Tax=Absidia repens TaxID=90262 RepID=A0A1X2I2Y9_9FUNG|nr:hypothetical protein BCR42DRAFT_495603 [Absidia repens]